MIVFLDICLIEKETIPTKTFSMSVELCANYHSSKESRYPIHVCIKLQD